MLTFSPAQAGTKNIYAGSDKFLGGKIINKTNQQQNLRIDLY
jgi:starvation-inducible outer membrane lipoprotein